MEQAPLEGRKTEYIKFCDEKIRHYDRAAEWNRRMNARLQIIIITGAAITPFLVNIPQVPKIFPTALSTIVALAAGAISIFKFGNYWITYRSIANDLMREKRLFNSGAIKYKGRSEEEAFDIFVTSVEEVLNSAQPAKQAQST